MIYKLTCNFLSLWSFTIIIDSLPIAHLLSVCNDGDVQLVGIGSNVTQGTVHLCYNHQWGVVCDNGWDINEAIITCRLLGYYGMLLSYCFDKNEQL